MLSDRDRPSHTFINIALFAAVVLIWGLTWFAIHLQIGGTTLDVAIFWRFALSVLLLGIGLAFTARLRRPSLAASPWLAAMGACLFSCNFLAIYGSETFLPSGTVSVVFSMATILNALNQWLFFRQRPNSRILIGGAVGVCGVALLLGGGTGHDLGKTTLMGMGLALLGTTLFSFGNMLSRRMTRFDLGLLNTVFYAMVFGTLLMGANVAIHRHSFTPPMTTHWIGGLLYLSLFGSVAGFLFYLMLVQRIGADKAAYTTILSPVIALCVSAIFEGGHWSALMVIGLVLIMFGNLIAFARRRSAPTLVEVEQG